MACDHEWREVVDADDYTRIITHVCTLCGGGKVEMPADDMRELVRLLEQEGKKR